jgi:hypothetical protein
VTIRRIGSLFLANVLAFVWPTVLMAQNSGPEASALYIIFLHRVASSSGARAGRGDRAGELHLAPAELQAVDDAARVFVAQEEQLRQEALRYGSRRKLARESPDPAVVHSFAVRRASLASSAMAVIQAKISPPSFAGLRRFIDLQIRGAVGAWR